MKKRLLLVFVCMFVLLLTGCGSNTNSATNVSSGKANDDNGGQQEVVKDAKALAANIESSGALTLHGKLVVFVKNKNEVPVDMEIEVEFYDADNTIVGSDKESLSAVGKNSEIAVDLWDTPDKFDNYKIYVDVEQSDKSCYVDKLDVTHKDTKDQVAVQAKNNSSDEIDYITVSVVYYKDGKVVGYGDGIQSEIKEGRSANFNIRHDWDKKYNNVKFDEYKVFINEAYSYNW